MGVLFRAYQEFKKLNNPVNERSNEMTRKFSKDETQKTTKHEKKFNLINQQRNANLNYKEIISIVILL